MNKTLTNLAHEIYAAAQTSPGEGIEDAAARIEALLAAQQPEPQASAGVIAAAVAVIEADRAHALTDDHIDALDIAIKIQRGIFKLPEPRAEVMEEQPSLTNPLTPYGMLVRALRIVSGTTLMDMAQHLGRGPAELSSIEFGRKPVRNADILDAAHFFACVGIQSTTHALTIAARAGEGQ
ncbi:transcriptional regulator [Burkholderia sp. AU45274]|uniref:transcriptional regulator n=1 Tax=Burkholderia sp. AU45274 TaxID=3059205 RepID=UPI0026568485|nr:transcriptional regulator [Burkholderia sp. AU45274]MDN7490525.1 transcriptional regulator [Burkholderia sp. AU45274]